MNRLLTPAGLCLVLCLMALSAPAALAGPNAGGTIIAHDAGLLMSGTNGSASICGQGLVLSQCDAADVEIDGATGDDPAIFVVYAAFYCGSSPRVMGITWGVDYDANALVLPYFGKCGDFELNDDGWPAPGKGSTVTWNTVQTSLVFPVYWFAGYSYGAPGILQLIPNPGQGGNFGDDSVPAILDPIAGYGSLGFDVSGTVACASVAPEGACCNPDTGACELTGCGECLPPRFWIPGMPCEPNPCGPGPFGACCLECACTLTTEEDCPPPGLWNPEWTSCDPNPCDCPPPIGVCCNPETLECTLTIQQACAFEWHPEWLSCEPNPCLPVPAEAGSWGQIKARYR